MIRRVSWVLVLLFGLALTGTTLMNLSLTNRARAALGKVIEGPVSPGPPPVYHLALVIPDTRDPFFDGLTAGVEEAAKQGRTAVQVFRYHALAPDQAETYFQLCLSARLDGVVLYSASNAEIGSRLPDAASAGVVFVPVGTQVPAGASGGFVGSSRLLQGVEAGNLLAQRLGAAARVGILLSPEGETEPADDPVYQGVSTALKSYPGAKVVRVARAKPGLLSGEESASLLLRADPSINVLVCASGPITEGAAQVIVDQGRVGQVLIVGTDESPMIRRWVDKGVILASIVRDSRKMGAEAVRAFALARGGTPAGALEVGFTVRTGAGQP